MKILYVAPHYEPAFEMGGVVRTLSQLCRGMAELGHDVTVFTTNNNRLGKDICFPSNREVIIGGVKVWYFATKFFKKSFFYSPDLGKACQRRIRDFDILHLSSLWCYPGIPFGNAARQYQIPYVMSPHGSLDPRSLAKGWLKKRVFMRFFDKKNLNLSSAIHYTSELERNRSHGYNKLKSPSFVVPNPVDLDGLATPLTKEKAREYLNLPKNAFVISFIGRLNRIKALDILVYSFKRVLKELDNCYLIIGGPDDGFEANLRRIVAGLHLIDRAKILGALNQRTKNIVIKSSDLLWLASYEENFGHAAVEAMAAGVPVIVSKNVGISPDILEHKAGVIVDHVPNSAANIIVGVLRDKLRREKMAINAKNCANNYARERVVPLMAKAYNDILTGKRSDELKWL